MAAPPEAITDWRNIRTGWVIPDEGYCDQPYVVVTRDGHWLCTLTTGRGQEGQRGQHVAATISTNQGRTWSNLIAIEPADGPEASWAVPLATPGGRVYVFYDYNGDQVETLGSRRIRADMLGWYVFRFSDDQGRTWSKERYRLPVRVTACDRANDWAGQVQIFWGISKPVSFGSTVLFGFTKLGRYMLENGEGWFFRSDNILTEPDPGQIHWQLLPEGDHGLRAPEFGSIQEEHNLVVLSGGSLFCLYRTTMGHPCQAYSRDGGRTWTRPEPAVYSPGGPRFKHPRACPKIWKTSNGRFLFWFHHHGGKDFLGRNPAWICGGVEK
ncbi:MAG: exo-alpha-sialidase, partial [Chloroflexi bacterium]|nr:exo-alpha-sialidase [Chloroflexota bacterium]